MQWMNKCTGIANNHVNGLDILLYSTWWCFGSDMWSEEEILEVQANIHLLTESLNVTLQVADIVDDAL